MGAKSHKGRDETFGNRAQLEIYVKDLLRLKSGKKVVDTLLLMAQMIFESLWFNLVLDFHRDNYSRPVEVNVRTRTRILKLILAE